MISSPDCRKHNYAKSDISKPNIVSRIPLELEIIEPITTERASKASRSPNLHLPTKNQSNEKSHPLPTPPPPHQKKPGAKYPDHSLVNHQ